MEPVYYYGHLGINQKCPDYQGVLIIRVSLYDKATFGIITKCVDYAGVLFKWPDQQVSLYIINILELIHNFSHKNYTRKFKLATCSLYTTYSYFIDTYMARNIHMRIKISIS